MGRGKKIIEELQPAADMTEFVLNNGFAFFSLLTTDEIKFMCMLGYTFFHGNKVFTKFTGTEPFSYKFASMILACTGGGILVPIFINLVPVPLSQDSYPIAIVTSYLLHTYFPILREVLKLSTVFRAAVVFLYEVLRAFVVCKLTKAAGAGIPASEFSFPVFGPIFCGSIAGCGGMFLPLDKGLSPLKEGLNPPMLSAFIAATFFHLFINLSDVKDAPKKGQVAVAAFFVIFGFYKQGIFDMILKPAPAATPVKKEDPAKVKKES